MRTSTNRSASCVTIARACLPRPGREAPVPEAAALVTHRGGCHCGAIAFEVDAPARVTVSECDCSICRMSGYLHLIVPRARFRLLRGADALSEYTFNTGTARHLFCRRCGVKSFYVPRSNPEGYSVNVRCLDQSTLEHLDIEPAKGAAFAG
ncbi:MAG: GFA family protein [Gammaproteobacteria bacterium]|nr:MAG: GFA family protein [Gammaproteobacteria bacterium]